VERPSPEEYQPSLTRWGHAWRLAVCAVISGFVWAEAFQGQWEDYRWWWWLDLLAGIAAFGLVLLRRRHPLAIAVGLSALALVSGVAAGPATLASVSLATRQRLDHIVLVSVVGIVASQGYVDLTPGGSEDPFWLSFTFNVIITVAIMGWGSYIGSRRQWSWQLRMRAERAEAEQDLRAREAQATERQRIAREMHDVLAHRISQISMHAGALAYRTDLDAGALRRGTADIQTTANAALNDLREVLGVLRDDAGAGLEHPQPTYADVPALVADAQASGMNVAWHDRLGDDAASLPATVGRTIYRIVQEGITNARKHAPGALLTVEVSGAPGQGVDLLLANPVGFGSRVPGSGVGLIGLSERAGLGGGRLEHRQEGGRFVLRGWLPWQT
jgi:signal transduction histidine kinase